MNKIKKSQTIAIGTSEELLKTLKARFGKNVNRHKGLEWAKGKSKAGSESRKTVVTQ